MPRDAMSFEAALTEHVTQMIDACTKCGKCVEVCPSVEPAGLATTDPKAVITGVLDVIRGADGSDASRLWAQSCMQSGECITACDYGVNPRFVLTMARVAIAKDKNALVDRRRLGVERYRNTSRDVTVLSRLQLDAPVLVCVRMPEGGAWRTGPNENV
jgi:heterodisulfide reductase subunit D